MKLDPLLEEEFFYHLLNSDLLQELIEMISEKGEEFIASGYTNSLKEMMDKSGKGNRTGDILSLLWRYCPDKG